MAGFDQHFCDVLEYHLTKAFGNSSDNEFKYFWCDGVAMPFVDSQLLKGNITKAKKIETEAWIGTDGQTKYNMTIRFGEQALEYYLNDGNLEDCLPSDKTLKWVKLDVERKLIELQLK